MTRIADLVKKFLANEQAPGSGVDTAQELEKIRQYRLKFLYIIKDDAHAWELILNHDAGRSMCGWHRRAKDVIRLARSAKIRDDQAPFVNALILSRTMS